MTKPILVDSNIWIANFNKADTNHFKAKGLIRKLPHDIPLLISNLIVYEVLTVLSMRVNHKKALKFGQWLFPRIEMGLISIVYIDEYFQQQSWELFKNIQKKDISFTDCTSAVIAKESGLEEILTFDSHFKIFQKDFNFKIFS